MWVYIMRLRRVPNVLVSLVLRLNSWYLGCDRLGDGWHFTTVSTYMLPSIQIYIFHMHCVSKYVRPFTRCTSAAIPGRLTPEQKCLNCQCSDPPPRRKPPQIITLLSLLPHMGRLGLGPGHQIGPGVRVSGSFQKNPRLGAVILQQKGRLGPEGFSLGDLTSSYRVADTSTMANHSMW